MGRGNEIWRGEMLGLRGERGERGVLISGFPDMVAIPPAFSLHQEFLFDFICGKGRSYGVGGHIHIATDLKREENSVCIYQAFFWAWKYIPW